MIKFETLSYLYSLIGLIKTKLIFKRNKVNSLEIGLGESKKKKGFITSDLNLKTDFPYDLRLGLPFPNESIDLVYSEHVLEHFSYGDLISLLKDCYRVLKPNGVFSLVVPNARKYIEGYFHPEIMDVEKDCVYQFGLSYKSKIDYVNYIFYMDGQHRYMFDEENILTILSEIGFKDVKLRNFDPALDKEERKHNSLYAEGIK